MAAKEKDEDAEEEDWKEESELDESAAGGPFCLGRLGSRQARGCRDDSVATVLFSSSSFLSPFCTHLPLPRLYSTPQPPIGCWWFMIGCFLCHLYKVCCHPTFSPLQNFWVMDGERGPILLYHPPSLQSLPPLLLESFQIWCNLVTSASHMTITAVLNDI